MYGYKKEGVIYHEMLNKADYEGDGETAAWYTQVAKTKTANMTNPYEFDGETMVSVSFPIIKDGQLVGVISTDLNFGNVKEMIRNLGTDYSSYHLADSAGNIIVHGKDDSMVAPT